jgi:hypothetical protein
MESESAERAPYSRPALRSFIVAQSGLAIDIIGGACSPILVFPVAIGIALGIAALVLARRARIDFYNHPTLAGRKLALAATVIGILLIMPLNVLFIALLSSR